MGLSSSTSSQKQRRGLRLWLFELDRILRGDATRQSDIRAADIKIPVVGVSVIVIILAVLYGFCMGIFALIRGVENSEYQQALMQTLASMCKVPLLFGLTLLVTFPSLYVFNALVGSRLRFVPVLKLLVASLAVNLAVLASMGPILAFFSVSTPNYPFIVLLNVVVFAIAGLLGLAFLIQTLNRLSLAEQQLNQQRAIESSVPIQIVADRDKPALKAVAADPVNPTPSPQPNQLGPASQITARADSSTPVHNKPTKRRGPLDHLEGIVQGRKVILAGTNNYLGLVGAQMGWVLRPFIGSPNQPFQWFRSRHSNFFESVINTLFDLLS